VGAWLAWHAAGDWHRHGGHGIRFFHLHVHLGDHHHGHHDADRTDELPSEMPQRDHEGDDGSSILTISQGMQQLPAPALALEHPEREPGRVLVTVPTERSVASPDSSATPRAPPSEISS
jgi:hypothetical protein